MHLPRLDSGLGKPAFARLDALPGVEWAQFRGPHEALPSALLPLRHGIALLDGGYDVLTRGKTCAVTPGAYCVQPGEPVSFCARGGGMTSMQVIIIDTETMARAAVENGSSSDSVIFRDFSLGAPMLRAAAESVWLAAAQGSRLVLQSAFCELLRVVFDLACESPGSLANYRVHPGLNRARDLILDRSEAELELEELASAASLTKTHFVRAFRQAFGLTPHAFLMHVRLERARTLLHSGWRPIDVAMEVGFCDQSHLHRWCKRMLRLTPRAYAKAMGTLEFAPPLPSGFDPNSE